MNLVGANIVLEEAEAVARLIADGHECRAVAVIIVAVDYDDGEGRPKLHTGHATNARSFDDPDNAMVNITIGIADAIKGMFEERG